MIRIARDSTNSIRLREHPSLASPYFLCWFYCISTKLSVYCICPNTSSAIGRQDLTLIEVGSGTAVPLTGRVALSPSGEWRLRVYEQDDNANLDPANATAVLYDVNALVTGTVANVEFSGTTCPPSSGGDCLEYTGIWDQGPPYTTSIVDPD